MKSWSLSAVAVMAAALLAVSGCGGTETAAPPSDDQSNVTAPETGSELTSVSFDVSGMT